MNDAFSVFLRCQIRVKVNAIKVTNSIERDYVDSIDTKWFLVRFHQHEINRATWTDPSQHSVGADLMTSRQVEDDSFV